MSFSFFQSGIVIMSMIRNLLYNRTINSDCIASTLYNQTLLYKFIAQHQPKYIIHCGCPYNALYLANFIKENYPAEILHIKNWTPHPHYYLDIIPEIQNPHQAFLDKITENNLENHLVSLNSNAINAAEILKARHLKFDMLISDTLNNDTDYMPLLPLIQKKNLHIRYVGHQKISDIKHEAIFESDHEVPVTYAQGYLITGMDYLSLYDEQPQSASLPTDTPQINVSADNFQKTIINTPQPQPQPQSNGDDAPEMIWTENGFVLADNPQIQQHSESQHSEPQDTPILSEAEARLLRREERRQAREERREQRMLSRAAEESHSQIVSQINNVQKMAETITQPTQQNLDNSADESDDNNQTAPIQGGISATRQALRARRLARRMAMMNNS